MAEETMQISKDVKKRNKFGHSKSNKGKKKKMKMSDRRGEFDKPRKMDPKFKKMLKRKARDYNSDTDEGDNDDENENAEVEFEKEGGRKYRNYRGNGDEIFDREEEEEDDEVGGDDDGGDVSEDESGEIQPGIMRFTEGCKAFRMAFKKIVKTACDDVLGPVLSAHKKLVAEKLAEEDVEQKVKSEAKKEKHLISEKGHVKPANFLDTHEKLLISVATKGVVKLFNAVNKAQHAQKGLNPSRAKDQKAIKKRRKEAFFSELKNSSQPAGITKIGTADGGPAWAPLRDDFMLTKSKLKDWDKKPDTTKDDNFMASDADASSSGED